MIVIPSMLSHCCWREGHPAGTWVLCGLRGWKNRPLHFLARCHKTRLCLSCLL